MSDKRKVRLLEANIIGLALVSELRLGEMNHSIYRLCSYSVPPSFGRGDNPVSETTPAYANPLMAARHRISVVELSLTLISA